MAPAPGLPQGLGCEMHNQCNIHGLNDVFVFFQQILYNLFIYIFCVCTLFFSSLFAFNLFVNM